MRMTTRTFTCLAVWGVMTSPLLAGDPYLLQTGAPDDQSVYAPPAPPRDDAGVNEGAVTLEFDFRYMTDYVYRGVDYSEVGGGEDAPNLQFDGKVSFDLGRLPHPFLGVFANVYNSDPDSRFQEVRPYFGFDWTIRPITITAAHLTYIYPERDDFNTSEGLVRISLDDSYFFRTEKPIFSPYILGAYDYDQNNGWYGEAGIVHEFVIEDTGVTLTFTGAVGYIDGIQGNFIFENEQTKGFSHAEIGLVGNYSLNNLLNIPKRYGEFLLKGYLYYTEGLDNDINNDTQIWGGMGIGFKY